jgi:hypothetical protein
LSDVTESAESVDWARAALGDSVASATARINTAVKRNISPGNVDIFPPLLRVKITKPNDKYHPR